MQIVGPARKQSLCEEWELYLMVTNAALKRNVSRQSKGYWQEPRAHYSAGNPRDYLMFDFLTNREIAELLFWWAGVAMPITTVVVILYARAQLAVIASQAQATLLLNLIDKWNSDKMHRGRAAFDEVEATAKGIIFTQHVGLSEKEVTKKLQEHFRMTMASIDTNDSQKYTYMLEIISFFELVGMLVKGRYVLLKDIDGLFRGPILDYGVAYVLHIKDEQQKRNVPDGYYENALFLFSEIEKICS